MTDLSEIQTLRAARAGASIWRLRWRRFFRYRAAVASLCKDLALDGLYRGDVLVAHRLDGETRDDLHEHPEIVGGVGLFIITAHPAAAGAA